MPFIDLLLWDLIPRFSCSYIKSEVSKIFLFVLIEPGLEIVLHLQAQYQVTLDDVIR